MSGKDPGEELCDDAEKSVVKLRKLLSENEKLNVLEECDSAYLMRFLYSTDFSAEGAFKKMKMFYDTLAENPKWFTTDPPSTKKTFIDQDIRIMTNARDNQGRPIYIVKIGKMNARTMDLVDDVVPVDDFFMEFLLSMYPLSRYGVCVIIDISNLSWSLLKWLTPGNIKTALRRMDTMPIKEYKFHVVNSSRILNIALNILWPFLPRHIKEGLVFHLEDWSSLHKHIDKEVLPPEYGGSSEMDYSKLREQLYEHDIDIENRFRIYRQSYLSHIEKS